MSTLEKIQKIRENKLRQKIIIPLYNILGCSHVRSNCGTGERGKDVLFKERDKFSDEQNGAVIIKAKKIGHGAVLQEVIGQLKDAHTAEYPDPSNPRSKIKPNKLDFITNKEITKEAYGVISSQSGQYIPIAKIVDGISLAQIIDKKIQKYNSLNNNKTGFVPYGFNVNSFSDFCGKYNTSGSREERQVTNIHGGDEGEEISL